MRNKLWSVLVALMFMGLAAQSQENYATYKGLNHRDEPHDYKVMVAFDDGNDKFKVFLEARPLNKGDRGGFLIESNKLDAFVAHLELAKDKFEAYTKEAEEDEAVNVTKTIEATTAYMLRGYWHEGSNWMFDNSVSPNAMFTLETKEEGPRLWVNSGAMNSSIDESVSTKGFAVVVDNLADLNNLILVLNKDKILASKG